MLQMHCLPKVKIGDVANLDVPEDWEDRLIFSIYGQQTPQGARTEVTTATPVDVAVNFGLKYLCITFGRKSSTR
jgi:hypothetical protein